MVNAFGASDDTNPEEGKEDKDFNPSAAFPEAEVDEMRAQRDVALASYVQERERREALMKTMKARGGDEGGKEGEQGGYGESGGRDEGGSSPRRASAGRSSSRGAAPRK